MIWHNTITHNGYASDAVTSQATAAASVGLSDPRRICPLPSRRKRRS